MVILIRQASYIILVINTMSRVNMIVAYIVIVFLGVGLYFGGRYLPYPYLKAILPCKDSMFESLKLIIYPSLIYMVIDLFIIRRNVNGAFSSYITGIIVAIVFKLTSYYTLYGIIGDVLPYIEYIIYGIAIGIILYYRNKKITLLNNLSSVIVLLILAIMLAVFSYFPSSLSIFS